MLTFSGLENSPGKDASKIEVDDVPNTNGRGDNVNIVKLTLR
jgi:hypothetical protein